MWRHTNAFAGDYILKTTLFSQLLPESVWRIDRLIVEGRRSSILIGCFKSKDQYCDWLTSTEQYLDRLSIAKEALFWLVGYRQKSIIFVQSEHYIYSVSSVLIGLYSSTSPKLLLETFMTVRQALWSLYCKDIEVLFWLVVYRQRCIILYLVVYRQRCIILCLVVYRQRYIIFILFFCRQKHYFDWLFIAKEALFWLVVYSQTSSILIGWLSLKKYYFDWLFIVKESLFRSVVYRQRRFIFFFFQ